MAKAVFFDLDGTLADTKADLCATVNHTRRDLGLAERPEEEIIIHIGLGARHLLANAIPERAGEIDDLWRIFMSHYGEHAMQLVTLYPGVMETLETLAGRGWLLGVNTAKPAFATHAVLEHLGIKRFFGSAIVAGGDCPEMKPSALPLKMCAEKMGHTLTSDDWMVGDNWTDIECANNAGVKSAFCEFGIGILKGAKSTANIASFTELVTIL